MERSAQYYTGLAALWVFFTILAAWLTALYFSRFSPLSPLDELTWLLGIAWPAVLAIAYALRARRAAAREADEDAMRARVDADLAREEYAKFRAAAAAPSGAPVGGTAPPPDSVSATPARP